MTFEVQIDQLLYVMEISYIENAETEDWNLHYYSGFAKEDWLPY
jgi:hypothetical protein